MEIKNHILQDIKFLKSPNFNERPKNIEINLLVIHSISLPPKKYNTDHIEKFFMLQIATLGLAAMFVVLAVGGIVQMMGTDKDLARAEFVGYLLLSPLIPVGGWWWAKNDETRWGAGVLMVVGLVMPVLVVRIQQVWAGV